MSAINQMFMGVFSALSANLNRLANKWYPRYNREIVSTGQVRWVNDRAWRFPGGNGVMTSTDGLKWDVMVPVPELEIPGNIGFNDVAYGAGLYVMVGGLFPATGGTALIVTSPDGITWTKRTNTLAGALSSIAWSPTLNLFLAVGGTRTMTSSDGINWTLSPTALLTSLTKVVWGGDKFAAINSNGTASVAYRSINGTTFTASNSIGSQPTDIDYSPTLGMWAVSKSLSGTAFVSTSTDLISWTGRNITGATTATGQGITWSGDRFVVTANGSGPATSTDGVTWTVQNTNLTQLGKMCGGPSNMIIAATHSDKGVTASFNNGVSWATSNTEIASVIGQFKSRYSTVTSFAFDGSRYWASCANDYSTVHYSYDNKTWYTTNLRAAGFTSSISFVVYAASAPTPYWIAAGTNGSNVGHVFSSFNADSWTLRSGTNTARGTIWISGATNGTRTVIVNNSGVITYTDDGVNFLAATGVPAGGWRSVVFANGKFVTIGGAAAAYSVDGAAWTSATTSFTVGGSLTSYKLIHNGTQFIAVGTGTASVNTKVSTDGITWANGPLAPWGTATVSSLVFNGSVYVVKTDSNTNTVYVGAALSSMNLVELPSQLISAGLLTNGGLVANGPEITLQSGFNSIQLSSTDNGATWKSAKTAEQVGAGSFSTTNQLTMLDGELVFMRSHVGVGYPVFSKFDPITDTFTNYTVGTGNLAVYSIIKAGSTYVAGIGNTTTSGQIFTSPDLKTWTSRLSVAGVPRTLACNNDGSVIVAGFNTGGPTTTAIPMRYSTDGGVTWNTIANDMNCTKIIWDGTQFIVVGTMYTTQAIGQIRTSPDGINWTGRWASVSEYFSDIAYGNGIYIATDGSNTTKTKFYVSTDSINWTAQGPQASNVFSIAYGGGRFWAVGNTGIAYSTTNGTVYSTVTMSQTVLYSTAWDGVDSFWALNARGNMYQYDTQ